METHMLVVKDSFLKQWTMRLDEIGLTYKEMRGAESVIVVYLRNDNEVKAYNEFLPDFIAFEERLRKADMEKRRKYLACKNFFRRITFREPAK